MMVAVMNTAGAFPARYWNQGSVEHWENLSGERYHEEHEVKAHACAKCFMACGRLTRLKKGRHKDLQLEGPEYETIYSFGGLCMITEMEEVAYLNDLADRLGMDTITAAFNAVVEAYTALFEGAVINFSAWNVADAIKPLTETLTNSAPLIFAGLSVALAFRAGLFNIGAQGQLTIGAIVGCYIGFAWNLPWGIHMLVAVAGGFIGGALWGSIAGVLKAKAGAHEVIVTIMLNYIALYTLSYVLKQSWMQVPGTGVPESPDVKDTAEFFLILGSQYRLHVGFIFALLAAYLVWWLLERSTLGFEYRAVGANPHAARTAGINVSAAIIGVFVIAGGLAGLAGANQVLGTEHRLGMGIAGNIGFDAITVALLGKSKPLGVVLAGILLGGLRAGASVMQGRTGTPVDIVLVVQSLIVLFLAAPPLVRKIFRMDRKKKPAGAPAPAAA
jgi:simple sugar transport system permease protein